METKLYTVRYVNAGTEEYFCEFVVASDDPIGLLSKFAEDKNNEGVEVEEFAIDGYRITVEKVNK